MCAGVHGRSFISLGDEWSRDSFDLLVETFDQLGEVGEILAFSVVLRDICRRA